MGSSILIIEDDASVLDVVRVALKREGFEDIRAATNGPDAVAAFESDGPGLVILSEEIAERDEADIARVRLAAPDVPMLFLTSASVDPRMPLDDPPVLADSLAEPFDPSELVARVRALLLRSRDDCRPPCIDFGRFQIHPDKRTLVVEGSAVAVPTRQLDLLIFLAQPPGAIHSADTIYRSVWGDDPLGASDLNNVSVHIHRLREKIEPDPSEPQFLVTVRGLGYKLVQPTPAMRAEAAMRDESARRTAR